MPELLYREGTDRFVTEEEFHNREDRIKHEFDTPRFNAVVTYPFDWSTDIGPYLTLGKQMPNAGARAIGAELARLGFNVRVVLGPWNPNFSPSQATLDGRPIDILCDSNMGIHRYAAENQILNARSMEKHRPWIISGGPGPIYEPWKYLRGRNGKQLADLVIGGEEYPLLQVLYEVLRHHTNGRPLWKTYQEMANDNAFSHIGGLYHLMDGRKDIKYDAHDPELDRRLLEEQLYVDTGPQKLLEKFDPLPPVIEGFNIIERPHKGQGLSPQPLRLDEIKKSGATFVSMRVDQGCTLNCGYCPIPEYNQKAARTTSPEHVRDYILSVLERMGIHRIFFTSDNILMNRPYVKQLFTVLANTSYRGKSLGEQIDIGTEATIFHAFQNRDLFPLLAAGGLKGIWHGVEDFNSYLIDKRSEIEKVIITALEESRNHIAFNPMLINSDTQPWTSRKKSHRVWYMPWKKIEPDAWEFQKLGETQTLVKEKNPYQEKREQEEKAKLEIIIQKYPEALSLREKILSLQGYKGFWGLKEQTEIARLLKALFFQSTFITPSAGTEWYEPTYKEGIVFQSVRSKEVGDNLFDGNHVVASAYPYPAKKQRDVHSAYFHFYSIPNILHDIIEYITSPSEYRQDALRRFTAHSLNFMGRFITEWKTHPYMQALEKGPIVKGAEVPIPDRPVYQANSIPRYNYELMGGTRVVEQNNGSKRVLFVFGQPKLEVADIYAR